MKDPFIKAKAILQHLIDHGFSAYIVGGSVRDFLLGAPIHDIDIATSATPHQVISIFPKTFPVGIEHGTVLVRKASENYEVTTFRSESGYQDFRHPDKVIFETSIEKDLGRRDFTINAIAMDINGDIIDPYNGKKDLERRLLRTVGEPGARFKEDPLRMLRAVRFVAQLNLGWDIELQQAMVQTAPYLKYLAIERIREEFTKLLVCNWFDRGIDLLLSTKLDMYLPAFRENRVQIEMVKAIPFHSLSSSGERWALYLILLNCIKPEQFLIKWRFSNKEYKEILTLMKTFELQKDKEWDKLSLYRSGIVVAESVERMKMAAGFDSNDVAWVQELWNELPIKERSDLVVNGTDLCNWLDKKAGPWTGQLLGELEESVVLGNVKNDRDVIQRWLQRVN